MNTLPLNYYFVSLGCPKNLVDSQVMIGTMNKDGYVIVHDPKIADIIIVNTCSFIQIAREESIDTVLEMAQYKDKKIGRANTLVVSGCLAQHYKEKIETAIPEVDLVIGTGEYRKIAELLAAKKADPNFKKTWVGSPSFVHTEKDPKVNTGSSFMAYLKVSEGCNKNCYYCIIPDLRGRTRSRPIEDVVGEAKNLVASGVKELVLIAQDLTEYGQDKKFAFNLQGLLKELVKVEGLEWIRLLYTYPDHLPDEVIHLMATEKKIVSYIDMPIQHLNNRVLKSMNRRIEKERVFELVKELRAKVPGIFIRSSFIVGYPGETEEEFEELYEGLKELRLDHIGVFAYSYEESTKSGKLENQIPEITKKKRQRKIQELHQKILEENSARWIGQVMEVVVEGPHPDTELLLAGRHYGQAPEIDGRVIINDGWAHPGEIVKVKITEVAGLDLVGEIMDRDSDYQINTTVNEVFDIQRSHPEHTASVL